MIEDVLKEGGTISNAAQLNLIVAAFDIGHKITDSWDSRDDVGKTGNDALRTLRGHTQSVVSLLAMGGTKVVSSSWDRTIKRWDAATGKLIWTINNTGYFGGNMARIDETRIVSASRDTICCVHDMSSVADPHCLKEIQHPDTITCVAVPPNGAYFLTSCWDDIVRKWNSVAPYEKMGEYEGVASLMISFLDNERFLSLTANNGDVGEINLYRITTNNTAYISCTYRAGSQVRCITPMTTHTFVVALGALGDNNIQLWNSESTVCVKTFQGHTDEVNSLARVDDSHFISGSDDTTTKLWNTRSGGCLRTFKAHTAYVMAVAYIEEGRMMISGSLDQTIKVWSLGSILDSDGGGGAQHEGVYEEGNDRGNAADARDYGRKSDPSVDEMGRRVAGETKRKEVDDIESSITSLGDEWRDRTEPVLEV